MRLKNNENRIAVLIVASILILVGVLGFAFESPVLNPGNKNEDYAIIRTWKLPTELNEISGISWMEDGKLACVQDEEGIIFIFDLHAKRIEKKIKFGKSGDYEGIALVNNSAYILRSDGTLFEVSDFLSDSPEVIIYQTTFESKNNMESLTYDKDRNRLLLVPKEKDLKSPNSLGVYAFDLKNKALESNPVFSINSNDLIFKNNNSKKSTKLNNDKKKHIPIHPADIAINPNNGFYYIVDGKNPALLVLDSNGKPITFSALPKKTFNQPEGLTFSPEGTLYISNEGKHGEANILEVEPL